MSHRSNGHRRHGNLPPTEHAGRRVVIRTGIKHRRPPADLNATERLVLDVLDDEWVRAREISGFAGVTVEEGRRALATLRTLGLAESEWHRQVTSWRRVA